MIESELAVLHRTLDELRTAVDSVRGRYGDIPAVKRLLGDVERFDLDAADLRDLTPLAGIGVPAPGEVLVLDDTPHDPALWVGADDEGLGGYHR
ncbi:hypothetical protein [uncultured Jatrophihabitans sp.]|uniref:hypothetical protein n=1 Tax=uncultured Jatrophihabitans sp. TaxID=1610747 RepID=UPI0035CBBF0A